ncbi:hypothetical protein GJU42_20035 [Flavobacterium resistens]|uniref:Uncharacterized protein n=2 Tax=Flavobacterium resistens TaxID=443612 RepID=A0ABW9QBA4_9FLAO|nr:hypothetical protein [Flavobacterium resistens]MRX70271.1 hypothetical protein [Flavobacterium resistens]
MMPLKNIKMYKTILLITLVCFCFLTSCRSKRQETQKVETTIETNHEKIVTYKDTILFTPKSETSLKIASSELVFKPRLNKVEKPKIFTQKNGNATAKVEILPDHISVTATCDSLAIVAKIKNQFEKEYRNKLLRDNTQSSKQKGFTFLNMLLMFIIGFAVCYALKWLKLI